MSNLSIKSVPEALAETLRQRAARNHRSLQGELMAILEAAVQDTPIPLRVPEPARTGKSFSQVAQAFRDKFPLPQGQSLESATLIREMRDRHYGADWIEGGAKDGVAT